MNHKHIIIALLIAVALLEVPLQIVPAFCQPIVDGYASGDSPHIDTMARMTGEGWQLVANDTIAHDHDFSTTDDVGDDFWMSVWEGCDDAGNVYLAFLSSYRLFGVVVWLDFNGDGVFTVGSEPSPLFVSPDTPDFPCLYNFTRGVGYTDIISGASLAYGFNNTFVEIMVPKVEIEGAVNETVWDCMDWNYMLGVDANANFTWDGLGPDWVVTGWGSWCTFADGREHEMWNGTNWVSLQSWFACPYQPPEQCQVTFHTQPAENDFSINFLGATYNDSDTDTFPNGTSGVATTDCPSGWVFDHWETTGNVEVSTISENPTWVNITSDGTLKAIFYPVQCEVTFLTDPVYPCFNITFQSKNYQNGTQDVFDYGTSGLVTTNCSTGWVFDHWETTGNVEIIDSTMTIKCGGTLKAVFRPVTCQVIFLTDPVCSNYNITFQCQNYHNGTTDTFPYGTSGLATANCPSGWEFDHWETTGNVQVSNNTSNPTNVTINCGGTLKAIFRLAQCQVIFYTDPVCNYYYINFQCKDYHNGTTDTFAFGTSGLATANCAVGWTFDHWETTGNIQVSNVTKNPTTITICCGGTLKAVFKHVQCQVTFYTDPVCNYYYVTFQCHNYHNGTTDTFDYGTSGLATANCPTDWTFDHWETTGNIQISNTTKNPATITICCGGTLKAVFRLGKCKVTFLTDPVCSKYYITFQCQDYHNGTTSTFDCGTSGPATANCPVGWEFDHWEVAGNIQVSNTTKNPTCVTINCGGTLKAIFRLAQCQVIFYTDPVCNYYYINFQCKDYHNGTTDTFAFGTSGLATANCAVGWTFDHWETTGNIQVSDLTKNPTNVTVCCGGTLKAVFRPTPEPPDADFTWCPTTPKTCETVTFDASASTPNGGVIVSYKWNFGDGNITTGANPVVTHHYGSAGNYTVTLNVTDSEGEWDTETKTIKILQNPTACFTAIHHSLTVTFNASSCYDPDGYIISYCWNFDDGNIATLAVPVVTHNYAEPGTYNVTLTVIDNDGLDHSVKNSLTIKTLSGDFNDDGKVNILDISIAAKAFGTRPGDKNWNEIADVDKNGIINILDIAKIAKEFGKTL